MAGASQNCLLGYKCPYPHADFGIDLADFDIESADYSGEIDQ